MLLEVIWNYSVEKRETLAKVMESTYENGYTRPKIGCYVPAACEKDVQKGALHRKWTGSVGSSGRSIVLSTRQSCALTEINCLTIFKPEVFRVCV